MNLDTASKRQSSSHELDPRYSPGRDVYRAPIMSTSAIMNPAPPYASLQAASSQPYHPSASSSSVPPRHVPDVGIPNDTRSTDSRRNSNEVREHTRLPSIKEAFGLPQETRTNNSIYTYTNAPTSQTYAFTNPATTPTSRSFPPEPSPQQARYGTDHYQPPPAVGPIDRYEPRGPPPPILDSARQQMPSNTVSPVYSNRGLSSRHDIERRPRERPDQFGRYEPPLIDQYRGYPTAPSAPIQPYHTHDRVQLTSSDRRIDQWGPPTPSSAQHSGSYEMTLKRKLDVWDVEQNLNSIADASSRLASMSADAFHHAQRYSRSTTSEGNPTLQTCDAMLHEVERARSNLLALRDAVIEQDRYLMEQQQCRDIAGGRDYLRDKPENIQYESRDMHSERQNGMKRRGRAAPPGNCHSCHRAETPEWRRGPDGARTLCNACGLHYAKLAKKTASEKSKGGQQQGSSLRPRSVDGT